MTERGKPPTSPRIRWQQYVMPEPNTGCWLWCGGTSGKGYGTLGVGSMVDGTRAHAYAHRLSYEFYIGPIPDGLDVLHRCDTPPCVNPAHLFLGTHSDNALDAIAKGKWPATKLTPVDITQIRRRYRFRVITQRMLGAEYGVTRRTIEAVVKGWRDD